MSANRVPFYVTYYLVLFGHDLQKTFQLFGADLSVVTVFDQLDDRLVRHLELFQKDVDVHAALHVQEGYLRSKQLFVILPVVHQRNEQQGHRSRGLGALIS